MNQTETMSSNERLIRNQWEATPAKLTIKEIKRRSQFPKWQDCGKDEVYIGWIRRKDSDRVIIVRHKMENELSLSKARFEDLKFEELFKYGFLPFGRQICKQCEEFSTRINIDGRCQECADKDKEQE